MSRPGLQSLLLQLLVIRLTAPSLGKLEIFVLVLEPPSLLFRSQDFFDKRFLAISFRDSRTEKVGRALNDGAHLREIRNKDLAAVVLVVSFGIPGGAHPQHLQVSSKLGGEMGTREVEPVGASACRGFLDQEMSVIASSDWEIGSKRE